MISILLIFTFNFIDAFCGCMQVLNLVHGRRLAAFITSLTISSCKMLAIIMVIRATNPITFSAYIMGGTIGAQVSLFFRHRYHRRNADAPEDGPPGSVGCQIT